jgi:RNA polymerase sigma-70 factor (ECF subfamily)
MSIGDALRSLPPEQRAAIVAIDVEGYSVAEASVLLGVPIGTIKSRCARGRTKLAVLLGHLRDTADEAQG